MVARERGNRGQLPSYIAIPELRSGGAGFLGEDYAPFATRGESTKSFPSLEGIDAYPTLTDVRLKRRREFLQAMEQQRVALRTTVRSSSRRWKLRFAC